MLVPTQHSPEEAAELHTACGVAILAGTRFLKELEHIPEIRLSKPVCQVMVFQIRHQIEGLEAAMLISGGGRPHFVGTVARPMFETLLNILGIGWLSGKIGKVTYSRSYNARRFLAMRKVSYVRADAIEKISKTWIGMGVPVAEAEHERKLLLRRAKATFSQYECFDDKTNCWFHASGVAGLYERLWPAGSDPVFPVQLFPLEKGYDDWKEWYGYCWGHESNHVHASIVALTSRPDDALGKWPSLEPYTNVTNLSRAWSIGLMSLFAAADVLGKLPALNAIYHVAADQAANG